MSGMSIWEILLLGVGLSMDAFAVSICKGLSVKKVKWQHLLCVGAYFGIFQALMPTLGYFLGTTFSNLIDQFDHWVAFILLAIIGVNMVREALSKDEDETNDDFGFKTMLLLAIATSIDALAVGVTFALEGTDIALAAGLIGLTTFTLSPIGLLVGNRFGLLVVDECHHLPGAVYSQLAKFSIAPYRLGLTATPERMDGLDSLYGRLLGPICYRREITDLPECEVLSPYDTITLETQLDSDEQDEYRRAHECYINFVRQNRIDFSSPRGWVIHVI